MKSDGDEPRPYGIIGVYTAGSCTPRPMPEFSNTFSSWEILTNPVTPAEMWVHRLSKNPDSRLGLNGSGALHAGSVTATNPSDSDTLVLFVAPVLC